ncbi:archaetidylserine decarboxylase, partial [Proteus mirabilis]
KFLKKRKGTGRFKLGSNGLNPSPENMVQLKKGPMNGSGKLRGDHLGSIINATGTDHKGFDNTTITE